MELTVQLQRKERAASLTDVFAIHRPLYSQKAAEATIIILLHLVFVWHRSVFKYIPVSFLAHALLLSVSYSQPSSNSSLHHAFPRPIKTILRFIYSPQHASSLFARI